MFVFFVIFARMKAKLFVIGWFMLVLSACTSTKIPEPAEGPSLEFCAIDSLMWRHPDSALMRLLPWFDTCCRDAACHVSTATAYDRHYANLLLSELLYKNDYAQTNRTELQQAVSYFDSLVVNGADTRGVSLQTRPRRDARRSSAQNIAFLDARAHYINGVGYYERDSLVPACAEYLKTLEMMESRFGEEELVGHKAKFMTYTYNRLGDMFSEQFMMEPAIFCYKNSLVFSHISPISPYSVSSAMYRIGKQFNKKKEIDSASYYYSQAIKNMPDTIAAFYRDIVSSQTLLSYQLTHQEEMSLQRLKQMAILADDNNEKLTRYLVIGYIYFEEREYDSAQLYLKSVFENMDDAISQMQAAEYLRILYDSLDEKKQSDFYIHFLAMHKPMEPETDAKISNLSELFKNYLDEKQNQQAEKEKHEERKQTIKKTIGILVPILLFIVIIFSLLIRSRHKKNLEAERQAHNIEKNAISGRLKKSNQELRELKGQIKQQENNTVQKTELQAANFTDEPVCRLILERVKEGRFKSKVDYVYYKDYALDKEQIRSLCIAVDSHFRQFTTRLKKTYPTLTKSDLEYCCLYLLGLTDADVAALMQRAYSTISERNSKLRKIFGDENALSITLWNLANKDSFD